MMKKLLFSVLLLLITAIGAVAQVTVTIGEGTSKGHIVPVNTYFNYSLTQQIYTADEIGVAGTISSVAFYFDYTSSFSFEGIQLYMMHTTKSSFESNTDMVALDDAILVYNGVFGATTAGWITLPLTTTFDYNGTDNLLICMYDPTYGYATSSHDFRYTSTSGNYTSVAYYSDSSTPSLNDVSSFSGNKTYNQYHNNIQLVITPSGSVCMKPTAVTVNNITARGATVSWTAGYDETAWQICVDNDEEHLLDANTNSYDIEGLSIDASHTVKVRSACEGGEFSGWTANTSFRTLPSCQVPTELAYADVTTTSAVLSWTAGASETAWQICINNNETELVDVTENPYTLTGLNPNTTYSVKVRANCGDVDGNSQWTSAIQFTTPCEAISSLPYEQSFESTTCPAGCWSIEYAVANPVSNNIMTHVTDYAKDGSRSFRFSSYSNTSDYNQYLISPIFDIEGSYVVSFYYRQYSTNEHLYFGTSSTGNAIGDFTWTTDEIPAYSSTWTLYQKVVPAGTKYFAINYNPQGCRWYAWIDNVVVREASTAAEILTYSLETQVADATFDSENGEIAVTVAFTTDLNALAPVYTISAGAEISAPVITVAGNGESCTVEYDVTAEDGTTIKHWTVTVTKAQVSHDAFITAFTFAGQKAGSEATIISDTENGIYTVNAVAEWNTDITTIAPEVTISNAATVVPESGVAQDFSTTVTYTVTAEDGTTQHAYIVTIVNDPDACINPTGLQADDVTAHTATLNWVQGYTETSYLVKVSTTAMTDMTATADVFDGTVEATTKALEDLNANTQYFVYVQSVCDNAEGWVSAIFTTLCDAISEFPFTEGFELTTRPGCWTEETTGTHYWTFGQSGSSSSYTGTHSGSYNASYRHSSSGDKNKLVSPVFDFGEMTVAVLEFWRKNPSWSGDIDYLTVYYRTAGDAEWTLLESYTDASSSWKKETITLVNLSSTYQIAFEATDNYGYGMGLDDVLIREASTAAEILTYSLPTEVADATITSGDDAGTIDVTVANSTDFDTELTPSYTISENAEISAPTITGEGDVRTIAYTVTAEAGNTKEWTVNVVKAPVSHDAFITAFTFAGQKAETTAEIVSENDTYTVNAVAEWNVDLTAVAPTVTVSVGATVEPLSGVPQDFTADEPVTYTVTAEDGETSHTYTVTIVNDPDACINPATVNVTDITTTTATLGWAQAYTETSYLVKVSSEAMTDMTATADVFDGTVEATTKALEGLSADTEYYVYVQSDCDNADGWTSTSFTTLCYAIAEFPWTEDFNSVSDPALPSCWSYIDANNDGDYWKTYSNAVRLYTDYNYGNNDDYLILPAFELNGSYVLSYDVKAYSTSEPNDYKVVLSTTGLAAEDFNVVLQDLETVDYTSYQTKTITLNDYNGIVYIAMYVPQGGLDGWYLYFDNFNLRELNNEAEIVDFNFPTRMTAPVINSEAGTITTTASYQADLENLGETVTVSDYAEYVAGATSIEGNVKTFAYTVTAEDGTTTKDWTVTVTKAESASTANDIVAFSFVGQVGESAIDPEAKTVTAYAEWDFDLENNTIAPTIEVSPMATINPVSGDAQNFSAPVQYAVTAEDGESVANWTVTITNDPNACVNPDEITVENVTSTGATLTWDKMYQETTYIVKVSTVAYETEEDLLAATEFVYNDIVALEGDEATLALTDLTPATYYYVYVQSNCENAESWTVTYFATECDGSAYSVPFVETFDMSSNSVLCWTIIDVDNDAVDYGGVYGATWNIADLMGNNNASGAYIYSSYSDANDWLISPKIAVVDGAYLTFDYKGDGYYTEKFSVYVMDAPANYAEATQILATQIVDNADYESIANIDLSAYADQDIYIGIKCESDADQDVLFIDNFTVTLPVYTITATAGENGTISPESADVFHGMDKDFTITPAEGYRIATVVVDAETEGVVDVTENVVAGDEAFFYTFENVTANHTINVTFELIPTYTITVEAGEHGNVYYNDALVSAPVVVTEGATPAFEITPATGYEIDVLTVGGNTVELTDQQLGGFTYTFDPVMADITLTVTFVESVAVDMIEAGSMSIYPNPNNGMFSIDFSGIEGDATYQIINASGAVVETRDINVMNGETMNFNHDLRPGAYFVRIINGDKVYVEQIVVE